MANNSQVDRGWAWVVLTGAVFAVFLGSTIYMSGIYNLVFLQEYGESKYLTAWCAALHSSMISFMGPVTSLSMNTFGYRVTIYIGTVLCMVGYISCAFVSHFSLVFLTYGFIAGAGVGLAYMPGFVLLGYYFKRYRNIAYGVVTMGAGLGTMVFAPLTHYLIDEYGYKGSMVLMAGIVSHFFIVGAVMRPFEGDTNSELVEEIVDSINNTQENHLTIPKHTGLSSSLNLHHSKSHLYHSTNKLTSLHNLKSDIDEEDSKQLLSSDSSTNNSQIDNTALNTSTDNTDTDKQSENIEESYKLINQLDASEEIISFTDKPSLISPNISIEHDAMTDKNNLNIAGKRTVLNISIPDEDVISERNIAPGTIYSNHVSPNKIQQSPLIEEHVLKSPNCLSSTNVSPMISPTAVQENGQLKSPDKVSNCFTPMASPTNGFMKPNDLPLLLLHRNNHSKNVACSHPNLFSDKNLSIPALYYSSENIKVNSPTGKEKHLYTGSVFSRMSSDFIAQSVMSLSNLNLSKKAVHAEENVTLKDNETSENSLQRIISIYRKILHKDFIIFCANILLVNFGMAAAYVHIPAFGMENGSTYFQCSQLLSVMGIANILSRLLTGLATNINGLDIYLVYMGSCGLTGIVLCIGPVIGTTYYGQIVFAFLFGLYANCFIALMSPLTIELVGIDSLSAAYGIELFVCGIGFLSGPTIAGALYDLSGSYVYSLVLGGVAYILGSMVMMLIPLCSKKTSI